MALAMTTYGSEHPRDGQLQARHVITYGGAHRVTSMLRATEFNGTGHTSPTYTYT